MSTVVDDTTTTFDSLDPRTGELVASHPVVGAEGVQEDGAWGDGSTRGHTFTR